MPSTSLRDAAIEVLAKLMESSDENVRLLAARAILEARLPSGSGDDSISPGTAVDVLRAQRFELVDADGKVTAVLQRTNDPQLTPFIAAGLGNDRTELVFLDKSGNQRMRLHVTDKGDSAALKFYLNSGGMKRTLDLELLPNAHGMFMGMGASSDTDPIPPVAHFIVRGAIGALQLEGVSLFQHDNFNAANGPKIHVYDATGTLFEAPP